MTSPKALTPALCVRTPSRLSLEGRVVTGRGQREPTGEEAFYTVPHRLSVLPASPKSSPLETAMARRSVAIASPLCGWMNLGSEAALGGRGEDVTRINPIKGLARNRRKIRPSLHIVPRTKGPIALALSAVPKVSRAAAAQLLGWIPPYTIAERSASPHAKVSLFSHSKRARVTPIRDLPHTAVP